jgi:hypothetical protein
VLEEALHRAEVPTAPPNVSCRGWTDKHLLVLSFAAYVDKADVDRFLLTNLDL